MDPQQEAIYQTQKSPNGPAFTHLWLLSASADSFPAWIEICFATSDRQPSSGGWRPWFWSARTRSPAEELGSASKGPNGSAILLSSEDQCACAASDKRQTSKEAMAFNPKRSVRERLIVMIECPGQQEIKVGIQADEHCGPMLIDDTWTDDRRVASHGTDQAPLGGEGRWYWMLVLDCGRANCLSLLVRFSLAGVCAQVASCAVK